MNLKTKSKLLVVLFLICLALAISLEIIIVKNNEVKPAMDASKTQIEKKLTMQQLAKHANQVFAQTSQNKNLKLVLQTDERYAKKSYGLDNKDNDIAHNGCALTSLAMIQTFFTKKQTLPTDILKWAKNDYYMKKEGTMWTIFEAFAQKNNLKIHDFKNDAKQITPYLKKGYPVLVSVKEGRFTKVGHIMIITQDKNNKIRVYDPNDDQSKKHYVKLFELKDLKKDIINYWVFTK